MAVGAVLLNVPPPDVIDHVPVVAPPPTVAPDKVMAEGVADWHTTSALPALTVGTGLTVMVLSAVTAAQLPVVLVVSLKVTVPLKLAAGVYVTVAGVAVCAVLLNDPPPETMDHAPVVAPPPTVAPDKVMAEGDAD